jgi:rfaE bifunctional protein kinase chain/domain
VHPDSLTAIDHVRSVFGADKKIVFVSGNFNIIHPGHLRLLKFAADCGDVLLVGVNGKDTPGTTVSEDLRLEGVRAIGVVNYATLLCDFPADFIRVLRPAVVVKGKEHEGQFNPEQAALDSYGGHLVFSSGEVVFSSFDLMRREFSEINLSTISKPLDYPARHGFEISNLKDVLTKLYGLRVLVLGDLIVDEYIACDALGMSQEDPTIVVTPVLHQRFVGGAGIVAGHAGGLGAEVTFLSVTGKDQTAQYAAEKLSSYGVTAKFFSDDSRPTTLKQRFRAAGKTLLRVSHLKQHDIDQALQEQLLGAIRSTVDKIDLVVFADYNYGCLPQPLVDAAIAICMENGVPMVADSQSSSQVGDVSRFKNMLLLKPTEREARLALRDFSSGLVVLAEALRVKTAAKNVILTLGPEGLIVTAERDQTTNLVTDRLPAFNLAPKDTAGAGDSFLISASLAMVVGADVWQSAYLGALAAACQVGRIGNIPLTTADILAEIDS